MRRLQLEVTGACNLRCRMCLVRYRPAKDRHVDSFPLDRYVALLDELDDLEQVTLQGLGEPLLHPDLAAMVAATSQRGIRVGFNTNGTLLTERRIEALLDAGVDWMHVSVDGARPETFEHIRDGAHFGQVIRNLRRLVAARRRRGSVAPMIQLNAVLMRRNVHELVDLVRLAADVGVDRMWLQALSHDFSDTAGGDNGDAYVEIRSFTATEALWATGSDGGADAHGEGGGSADTERAALAEARHVAAELGLPLRLPDDGTPPELGDGATPDLPCDWPWDGAYVTHDGKVQPCCMVMGEDRMVLGDLRHASLAEIWRSPAYESFRGALLSDDPPGICQGCSYYRRVF